MKSKKLTLLLVLGIFLCMPAISFAKYTNEDLDYQGTDNGELGPVSIVPTLMMGTLSHTKNTIENTFMFDLGVVTIWVVDEAGTLYFSQEVNTTFQKRVTIDLSKLEPRRYEIICFNSWENQSAKFSLYK